MGGVGWGGVGHVSVMFMLRCCYVDGRGGVGWGMLTSCSCYVDATLMGGVGWGGVGHVNVMFMLRCCYVDGRGGVGWGMLPLSRDIARGRRQRLHELGMLPDQVG